MLRNVRECRVDPKIPGTRCRAELLVLFTIETEKRSAHGDPLSDAIADLLRSDRRCIRNLDDLGNSDDIVQYTLPKLLSYAVHCRGSAVIVLAGTIVRFSLTMDEVNRTIPAIRIAEAAATSASLKHCQDKDEQPEQKRRPGLNGRQRKPIEVRHRAGVVEELGISIELKKVAIVSDLEVPIGAAGKRPQQDREPQKLQPSLYVPDQPQPKEAGAESNCDVDDAEQQRLERTSDITHRIGLSEQQRVLPRLAAMRSRPPAEFFGKFSAAGGPVRKDILVDAYTIDPAVDGDADLDLKIRGEQDQRGTEDGPQRPGMRREHHPGAGEDAHQQSRQYLTTCSI